jgi:NAD(P)-dependent dehydrogenase (short-subunit alcohol dehydrogenase family)
MTRWSAEQVPSQAGRSCGTGKQAVQRILSEVPQAKVRFELLDLASLTSVRALAHKLSREPKLDLLIKNAGVMRIPKRQETEDGFERQFATNAAHPGCARTNLQISGPGKPNVLGKLLEVLLA